MIVKESINFKRGGSPHRRLGLGVLTWDKIERGDILKNQKAVYPVGSKLYFYENKFTIKGVPAWNYWIIESIDRKIDSDGEYIEMKLIWTGIFRYAISLSKKIKKIKPITDSDFKPNYYLANYPKEEWMDFFEILQPSEYSIEESLNFERGMDPKRAMRIGKNRSIEPGDKVILLSAFTKEPYDTAIVKKIQSDGGIVISGPGQIEIVFDQDHVIRESQFIRKQEPKKAMDIGLRTWDNIQRGDILLPKKEIYIDGKGMFKSSEAAGDTIWPDMFLIIGKVQKFYNPEEAKHIIHLEYFKCWDLQEALRRRNDLHDLITYRRMYGTRQQMENRFNILQRKDESKNS